MAVITRTSTATAPPPPTGSMRPSCRARSTLAWVLRDMSATSSRNRVPSWASLNLPFWSRTAPVKAPFTCPNSSDSISSSGMAAQFTSTNGARARGLWRGSARATSSLPLPFSPTSSTRPSVGATRSTSESRRRMAGLSAMKNRSWFTSRCRRRFSSSRCRCLRALPTTSSRRSRSTGFSRKSKAPSLVACMAVSMLPCPEIITTGSSGRRALACFRVSRPSIPGSQTSRIIRCTPSPSEFWSRSSACSPRSALMTP